MFEAALSAYYKGKKDLPYTVTAEALGGLANFFETLSQGPSKTSEALMAGVTHALTLNQKGRHRISSTPDAPVSVARHARDDA